MKELPKRTPALQVRIPLELIERIDAARRGTLEPREPFVRQLISEALAARERREARRRKTNEPTN